MAQQMDFSLIFYNAIVLGFSGLLPVLWAAGHMTGRFDDLWPRVGLYRDLPPAASGPRVWLQAVSVGEVGVAKAIASELLSICPQVQLTVTTSTGKGLETARQSLKGLAQVAAFPLEVPWAVAAAAAKIKPQVYASLETELWPNLFAWLKGKDCELLLLNGRISPRSYPRYAKAKSILRSTLRRLSVLSMISGPDAERITRLGADPSRVRVDGNAKYAGLSERVDHKELAALAKIMDLKGAPLLVAGSVRSGEEAPVLAAFAKLAASHPNTVLAVAPRHVEKSPRWLETASQLGLSAQRWSGLSAAAPRKGATQVVVVDAMGVLFRLYGLASAAFVGASLVPLGGQNPMEPAAWGVPTFHGPSMEDFSDAADALSGAGAAAVVADSGELARSWNWALDFPGQAEAMGQSGSRVVTEWSGSARCAAELIVEALKRKGALA
jgi:3-deoxy-D-manno-octulosonic-acid transferase